VATTLILDTVNWDLLVDNNGNIAVATAPYQLAQDAATAIKLFQGELWWNASVGVPYWTQILAKSPPISLMKTKFVQAAESVPGVTSAECFISSISDRQVTGQVQIFDETETVVAAAGF
jgi:hypothetical protein